MNELQSSYFKLALLVLIFPLFFGRVAQAQITTGITPPVVPDNLKAPTGELPFLKVSAKGVQIYICKVSATDATKFEWTLKAPEAELFNEQGGKVGKHYAGPTWEASDGSKVVGEVKERADSPGGKGIPWLLLKAKESSENGLLNKVSNIQRVETAAGFAPGAANCDQARKDSEVRVDYSATYYFYRPASAASPAPLGVPATGQGGTINASSFTNFSLVLLGLITTVSLAGLLILSISYINGKPKA